MKEVTAFVCDYCPKKHRYAARGTVLRHEQICYWNPARRACVTCEHFSNEPHYFEYDTGYSEGGPWCELGLLPIKGDNPEKFPKWYTADCEKWEPKAATPTADRG